MAQNNTIPHAPDYLLDHPGTSWDGGLHGRAWCHTSCFAQPSFVFPPRELQAKIDAGEETSVVVIGGGCVCMHILQFRARLIPWVFQPDVGADRRCGSATWRAAAGAHMPESSEDEAVRL